MYQATPEQIQEWKEKYHAVYELEAEGKRCYVFSPMQKLNITKQFMTALLTGSFQCIDCLFNNCWIAGDEEMKTDDGIKMSLVDKVRDFVEYPDHTVEFLDQQAVITIEDRTFRVRLATRHDIAWAEDRNRAGKPLDTQIYLLDRIAIDNVAEWRQDNRLFVSLLTAMDKVKERTYVAVKKL